MKVIVCYGDSNTWGADPGGGRHGFDERWPGVLRNALGDGYWVIEEGLNGRTTVWEDPIEEHKSGKAYLVPCIETHKPFDLIAVMLGTNDTKQRFSLHADDIAAGLETLVKIILRSDAGPDGRAPEVLVIAPPPIARLTQYAGMFTGARDKSRHLAALYERVAALHGCHYFDAGRVIASSDVDGIHFAAPEHRSLGNALLPVVTAILAGAPGTEPR